MLILNFLSDFISSSANKRIYDLVQDGLTYLDTRTEFWRQQNPLYARKKDKQKPKSKVGKRKGRSNFAQDVIRTLEDIDRSKFSLLFSHYIPF